ncbi:MAG: glycosyltransferase [Bacteroidota bacterium]|nr:glycosyltransferase [Bacteroidota bacterium]
MAIELSIVMPCLNEAETLEICVRKASDFLKNNNVNGEIIVADNGSTDGSIEIAQQWGARVVHIPRKGYGSALIGGFTAAEGKYIIMGDSDDSYDFSELNPFLHKIREGFDVVMGNRFKGGIQKGAMPFLHYWLGNPVLSFIGRLFFNSRIGDFHCGLRCFTKEAFLKMDLQTTGMEFATEMIVKAQLLQMKVTEVPTKLYPDGRSRPPHLRTWRDGWRHLRFMLLYSPAWLFLYPGLLLMLTGVFVGSFIVFTPVHLGKTYFDINTLIYMGLFVIVGFQTVSFFLISKTYAVTHNLLPTDKNLEKFMRIFSLEMGLLIGLGFLVVGIVISFLALSNWEQANFGQLDPRQSIRWVLPAIVSILLGVQFLLTSFFIGIMGLKQRN